MRKQCIEKFHTDEANNPFTYDDTMSFDENMLIYRGNLTEFERNQFDSNRQSKYWLTYTICIIYGIIAFIILILGMFSNWGKRVLFNELYIFVSTYIIGTIIIIIYLTYKVYTFGFPSLNKEIGYDASYCPDYWDSSITDYDKYDIQGEDGTKKKYFGKSFNKSDFNLKCNIKKNTGVYTSNKLFTNSQNDDTVPTFIKGKGNNPSNIHIELEPSSTGDTGLNLETDYKEFRKHAATMSGYKIGDDDVMTANNDNVVRKNTTSTYADGNEKNIPLQCDTVWPIYLANKDFKYAQDNGISDYNKFRCAYSKACNVPWTEAGCS